MLSTENPPSDLSSTCNELKHLKTGTRHETPSQKLSLLDQHLDPSFDHHQISLSNFSIRDYVFNARTKDIKKNWPFSQKNLQLCLENGVNDPLPPFQSLNIVREQSSRTYKVGPEIEKKTAANVVGESCVCVPDDPKLDYVLLDNNHKFNSNTCKSGGENDFPSFTTSVSQSEVEPVLPAKRPSSTSHLEADILLEASRTVPLRSSLSHKAEINSKSTSKKCRLIVKFGSSSDRSFIEDVVSNSTTVSETMASKTCPVCKTFSSSSNTTLNAHIDQCLSMESPPKWTVDSKLNRHRLKPRKIRLMTEIYVTAKRCTLEELDKRNGTSWAMVSSLAVTDDTDNFDDSFDASDEGKKQRVDASDDEGKKQRVDVSDEGKKQRVDAFDEGKKQRAASVHPEDIGDVGVYIDASGTKLRILSKLDDTSLVAEVGKDIEPKKSSKEGKEDQFFSTNKKSLHVKRHHKYLKLASQSRKFSHRSHDSEIPQGERYSEVKKSQTDELNMPKRLKPIKPSEPAKLKNWACSKRTGLTKKLNKQGCNWHVARNFPFERDQSRLHVSHVEANHDQKITNLAKLQISIQESSEMTEKSFPRINNKRDFSLERKRTGDPLLGGIINNKERSLPPLKRSFDQLSKESPSIHDRPTISYKDCTSIMSKKMLRTETVTHSHKSGSKKSLSTHSLSSKALKVSSPMKNMSHAFSQPHVIDSKNNVANKSSTMKNSKLHIMAESDEELEARESEMDEQRSLMHTGMKSLGDREESHDDMSFDRFNLTDVIRNRRPIRISRREETVDLRGSRLMPQCFSTENTFSPVRDEDNTNSLELVLSKSTGTKFYKPTNHSKIQSNSPQDYSGTLCLSDAITSPAQLSFVDERNMYCANEVENDFIGHSAHLGVDLDSEVGQGSFTDVDPIPIPGPPGSFLPSPRNMGSDDFPGNSSLTTSRVQSSQEYVDFIDGDSSESPISVASTISNSIISRQYLKYSEPFSSSVGAHSSQEKITSDFFMTKVEGSLDTADSARPTIVEEERDGERFTVHKPSVEKKHLSFRNDFQPCCCQRKEKVSHGVNLNYQDSQLLRRRTMTSATVQSSENQMSFNSKVKSNNLDIRPEKFPMSISLSPISREVEIPVVPGSLKASPVAVVKSSGCGDNDSTSPSGANPILRLMGKNLMVVNKEENASPQLSQTQLNSQNKHPSCHFLAPSSVSPGGLRNHDITTFHQMASGGSMIFGQNSNDAAPQYFSASNGFRKYTTSSIPQSPAQVPEGIFSNQYTNGGFVAPVEPNTYAGDYKFPSRHCLSNNKLGTESTYNMDDVMTALNREHRLAHSSSSMREIIFIDDIPKKESVAKYSEGMRKSQMQVSCGVPNPTIQSYNSQNGNSISCYKSWEPHPGGSPSVESTNFPTTPLTRACTSPARWGCTSESSRVVQHGHFVVPTSPTNESRSALYYSPRLL